MRRHRRSTMAGWARQSASALVLAIRERRVSSSELLEYFIERFERLNPKINAIVATNLVIARERARQADEALARGQIWGPLHGLPMTLKDNLHITGMPMVNGSPLLRDFVPDTNQDVVQSVLDAGAVVYGKTNLPLWGMDTQSFNEVYGQTNNPWDVTRTPGGSSGGAAAALAAGLTGIEIGNDIGGSIRFPAHFCGVYGHKPSFGIVSMHGGHMPSNATRSNYPVVTDLTVNGPLARSAEDLRLAMDIVVDAPAYQRKAISIRLPPPRQTRLLDFRVGVWLSDHMFPPATDVADALAAFRNRLIEKGVQLIDSKPDIELVDSHRLRNVMETAGLSHTQPQARFDEALGLVERDDTTARHWADALTMRHRDWLLMEGKRSVLRQKWEDYFETVDVLLCPVARIAAHPHDHTPIAQRTIQFEGRTESYWQVMGPWASMALVAYLPATVAPVGRTPDGLPVGVQIIGPYLEDMTPIQFAIELEKEIVGPFELPPGFED
ncbi:MAG: amidase [Gammaproteobacteria bacterium]|nr:amidase [Gammaproteobacteria bacterium]